MAYVLSMDVLISIVGMFRWLRLVLEFLFGYLKDVMLPMASDFDEWKGKKKRFESKNVKILSIFLNFFSYERIWCEAYPLEA